MLLLNWIWPNSKYLFTLVIVVCKRGKIMILDEPPKLMSFWADICWTVVNTIYTIHFKNNIRENSIFKIHTLFKSSICALCVQYRIIFPNNGSIWSIQDFYDQSGIHVVNIGQMWLIWGSGPGIILNLLKTAPVCSVQGAQTRHLVQGLRLLIFYNFWKYP